MFVSGLLHKASVQLTDLLRLFVNENRQDWVVMLQLYIASTTMLSIKYRSIVLQE